MPQKIIRLEVENVKRVSAVEIHPSADLTVIGGKNGQGKSSVLDAIEYALHGTGSHPSEPIKRGKKKARVVVETDKYTVTRTFTAAGGSALVVSGKDGARFPSPQKILDALISDHAFDPLAFATQPPREQLATLRRLTGLDHSALDAERKTLYDHRTEIGRSLKSAEGFVATYQAVAGLPEKEVSIADLNDQLDVIREQNRRRVDMEADIKALERDIIAGQAEISRIEAMLQMAQQALVSRQKHHSDAVAALNALPPIAPMEPIKEQIRTAETTNAAVRAAHRHAADLEALAETRKQHDSLTQQIKEIDEKKAASIASAKFPIDGLGFGENGITYRDIPFEQASSSERLRVSVAIGAALNPELRTMIVREGSLLDDDGQEDLRRLARENDMQIIEERVSVGPECSVIIEDGMIAGSSEDAQAPADGLFQQQEPGQ